MTFALKDIYPQVFEAITLTSSRRRSGPDAAAGTITL